LGRSPFWCSDSAGVLFWQLRDTGAHEQAVWRALEATVLVRLATAAGILVGIVCVASVTIVLGAIFGTVVGYLLEAVTKERIAAETTLEGTKAR